MNPDLLSIDIFLSDRFFHTMTIAKTNKILELNLNGSRKDCIDLNAVVEEVRSRIPSLRNRNDMHIYLN